MIVKVFLALPFFTKEVHTAFKNICVEFIPGTSRFCTNNGNNPVNLMNKVLTMVRVHTTPGCYKQHTYYSD